MTYTHNKTLDKKKALKHIEETLEDLETIEDLILSEVFNTGDDERMTEFRESLSHARNLIWFKYINKKGNK